MLSFIVTCSVDFPGKLAFFFLFLQKRSVPGGKGRSGMGQGGVEEHYKETPMI